MRAMEDCRMPVRMIVNADDFGFFDGVSEGILEGAAVGAVTAVGVMANGPVLPRWADRLARLKGPSIGVHLNATLGRPATPELVRYLESSRGQFPGKWSLLRALLSRRLSTDLVLHEWRGQIEHVQQLGLKVDFLNSHEHVHALPMLVPGVRALAREYDIPFVRQVTPEWGPDFGVEPCIRNLALAATMNRERTEESPIELIGLNRSGQLDAAYCGWRFPRLVPGNTYELMCHPGRRDDLAQREVRLRKYHDWVGELTWLLSPEFRKAVSDHGISLISFADLREPKDLPYSTEQPRAAAGIRHSG